MKHNFAGPSIMKDEIRAAIREMELVKANFDFSTAKETRNNRVWITYTVHRTISLMSHIAKILFRIIMMRVGNKIKSEITDDRCCLWREMVQQMQLILFVVYLNELWNLEVKKMYRFLPLTTPYQGIWQSTTQDNHTTNKFEDRWEKSYDCMSDQKYVVETDKSNAS